MHSWFPVPNMASPPPLKRYNAMTFPRLLADLYVGLVSNLEVFRVPDAQLVKLPEPL